MDRKTETGSPPQDENFRRSMWSLKEAFFALGFAIEFNLRILAEASWYSSIRVIAFRLIASIGFGVQNNIILNLGKTKKILEVII